MFLGVRHGPHHNRQLDRAQGSQHFGTPMTSMRFDVERPNLLWLHLRRRGVFLRARHAPNLKGRGAANDKFLGPSFDAYTYSDQIWHGKTKGNPPEQER